MRTARDQPLEQVDVDEAIRSAAQRLTAIANEHGPDSIALYVSGQLTIEAQYLANKLAKGFLRTVHIESNSRLCMASAGSGYKLSLGSDGPPGSYDDFDNADLFFVIGSNPAYAACRIVGGGICGWMKIGWPRVAATLNRSW